LRINRLAANQAGQGPGHGFQRGQRAVAAFEIGLHFEQLVAQAGGDFILQGFGRAQHDAGRVGPTDLEDIEIPAFQGDLTGALDGRQGTRKAGTMETLAGELRGVRFPGKRQYVCQREIA
jgi:hypothetical protein